MNKYLLISSIINGFIILLIIYNKYNPKYIILYSCLLLGIITSILNHGSNSTIYKYIDRFVIALSFFVFAYFIILQIKQQHTNRYKIGLIILFFASSLYLCSKLQNNIVVRNNLHAFSHFLLIIILLLVIM